MNPIRNDFFAMLHGAVAQNLREFFDPAGHEFADLVGEICRKITSEMPVLNLWERIEELCQGMESRASGARTARGD